MPAAVLSRSPSLSLSAQRSIGIHDGSQQQWQNILQAFSAVATCSTVQQSAQACWLRPTQRNEHPIDSILTERRHYYCTRLHVMREFLPALVERAHYWAARRLSLAGRRFFSLSTLPLYLIVRRLRNRPPPPLSSHPPPANAAAPTRATSLLLSTLYPPPASCVALVSLVCCCCSTCC